MLVFSAADFELFNEPRPELPPELEPELHDVVKLLVEKRWPFRIHATYDESITASWMYTNRSTARCHSMACTGSSTTPRPSLRAISAHPRAGWGIAVQHRMAYQGEAFVERYGVQAARHTPPVAHVGRGVPVAQAPTPPAWPATTRGWRCPGW